MAKQKYLIYSDHELGYSLHEPGMKERWLFGWIGNPTEIMLDKARADMIIETQEAYDEDQNFLHLNYKDR